jgi:hypothetical protein
LERKEEKNKCGDLSGSLSGADQALGQSLGILLLTRGLRFIVYISQDYVDYIQEDSGIREGKLGGARAWSRAVTIYVGVIFEAGVVDSHHFEAMTAEVMEFGEEGHVGGAVWWSRLLCATKLPKPLPYTLNHLHI